MAILHFFGAPWLGHGRATEVLLFLVCVTYGLALLAHPGSANDSQAMRDLAWEGYGRIASIPFLVKSLFSGYGVIANIKGWRYSRYARLVGALLGTFIWCWLISKFIIMGVPVTFGAVCALYFLIVSIRIIGMAWADLPKPGAPGAL